MHSKLGSQQLSINGWQELHLKCPNHLIRLCKVSSQDPAARPCHSAPYRDTFKSPFGDADALLGESHSAMLQCTHAHLTWAFFDNSVDNVDNRPNGDEAMSLLLCGQVELAKLQNDV